MNKYVQIEFQNISSEQSEILIAELAEMSYEGFEEDETSLKTFIPENLFDETTLNLVAEQLKVSFTKTIIQETNWNQVWESNFQPVVVENFVAIRADFHEPIKTTQLEIVITPKMSFGTGHHATTHMMIQQMGEIDFREKSVFDFGTGTGVLAILAEKLGAREILGTDNDEWSINNATENIQKNNCDRIVLKLSSFVPNNEKFDIILANINKNVILDNFRQLKQQLNADGILLLSGLLKEDESDVLSIAGDCSMKVLNIVERNNWLSIRLTN